MDFLKCLLIFPLPHHALSRLVLWLTRRKSQLVPFAIERFVKAFNVDMQDAVEPDIKGYDTFNAFFTRALTTASRPIATGANELASPADGRISAIGAIEGGQIYQAKGKSFSLVRPLGGDQTAAERLHNGRFATIYLSPRDYHRLHMPTGGQLLRQTHVPGRLYSVAPHTVNTINGIFAKNERVVAQFDTEHGLLALVLVGAINVAAIETVWHGLITPPAGKQISTIDYPRDQQIAGLDNNYLAKGAEMGRFNMGSTIIVLLENPANWRVDMQPGDAVRMGQFIGTLA